MMPRVGAVARQPGRRIEHRQRLVRSVPVEQRDRPIPIIVNSSNERARAWWSSGSALTDSPCSRGTACSFGGQQTYSIKTINKSVRVKHRSHFATLSNKPLAFDTP
jgi:hypothetical protein